MADAKQLNRLKRSIDGWNLWRVKHPYGIDLSEADLSRVLLSDANLISTNLQEATLSNAVLHNVKMNKANLKNADLSGADLSGADLSGADLSGADLSGANLSGADLSGADLSGSTLIRASLIQTNLTNALLDNASVYGISVWDANLEGAIQNNLIITTSSQPTITVDNLETAQLIHLLLNNTKVREVIDTITSKIVLILGRFTPERKAVLDAIREELRKHNYLPILFDFGLSRTYDFSETLSTLAHLSRFIIADLTDADSIPLELGRIIPRLPIPVLPLIAEAKRKYAMFEDLELYRWVLPTYAYKDLPDLLVALDEQIIKPSKQSLNIVSRRHLS